MYTEAFVRGGADVIRTKHTIPLTHDQKRTWVSKKNKKTVKKMPLEATFLTAFLHVFVYES